MTPYALISYSIDYLNEAEWDVKNYADEEPIRNDKLLIKNNIF